MVPGHCFFQAEDGIRYIGVTGVQTCALPISAAWGCWRRAWRGSRRRPRPRCWPSPENSDSSSGIEYETDRKSVVEGKSVDLGGRRIIKKQKKTRPNPITVNLLPPQHFLLPPT